MSNLPFDGRADKAEQQLLGSCLVCREALPQALEAGLTEDDFFGSHHRAMFAAMVALHRDGKACEIILVSARMQTMGTGNHLAAHGGDEYLVALGNEAPVSGFAELAQVLKLAAYDRQLVLLRKEQCQSGQSGKKRSELAAQIRRVQSERDRLAEYCDGWPGEPGPPRPFTDSQPSAWPASALPPVLAEFAQAVAAYSQVPESLPAILGLGTLSAAWAGKVVAALPNGHTEALSLYCVAAADVSERKSSTFAQFAKPIEDYQRERKEQLAPLRSDYEAERAGLQAEHDQAIQDRKRAKAGSPEHGDACDRAKRLREELDQLQPPPIWEFVTRDTTAEGLARLMSRTGGFALLFSPEGGGVFDRMAGHYDREPNLDVFLKSYDGETISSHRASAEREISEVLRPALAIVLTTQPATLQKLTEKRELEDRGLVARFLFALPYDSQVGHRTPNSPAIPARVASEYTDAMLRCLRIERPDVAHRLELSQDAVTEYDLLHWQIEPQLKPGGSLYDLRGWAGKLVGKIVRIAALFHLWQHTIQGNAAPWDVPISGDTFRRAAELAPWFIEHARAAFSLMSQSPAMAKARKLLDELRKQGAESFTTRDAQRLIAKNGTREEAQRVLDVLQAHNHVAPLPTERKDSQRWRVHPEVVKGWTDGAKNAA
jgi:replicative DNA helicase